MGVMVFIRQRRLDRELLRLLNHSRESIANLKRLQTQITESEKLASIGQLVGGAAHELNNPITAMLGYSDLLLTTPLTAEQHEIAARIGQHARRTRSLVASLLSFAKQSPAAMGSVDLTGLLRTAVRLSQPQWQGLNMEVRIDLPQELLIVRGDSNQLLQVCVQIINDALHVVHQHSSSTLTVAAMRHDGLAIVTFSDTSLTDGLSESIARDDATTEEDETLSGLGLNACQGILQQHQGRLSWQQVRNSGITIRVELPVIPAVAAEKSTGAGVPVMWQPQPSS
jgi:two-component system NtrC family sensor kinase